MKSRNLKSRIFRRFVREENGMMTILALYIFLISAVIGAVAIDFNKLIADRTRLQITADSVAHAALHLRQVERAAYSTTEAIKIADVMLPGSTFGSALNTSDIVFGNWDNDSRTFTANPGSKNAVRVFANQTESRGNAVRNIMLGMIGHGTFDAIRSAVFMAVPDPCYVDGFVAEDVVDIQSNNEFVNEFCIHSNTYVSLNNNNEFGPEVTVSMPNTDNLDMPNSGFSHNPGLEAALRNGRKPMTIIDEIPDIIDDLAAVDGDYLPDYINIMVPSTVSGKKIEPADLQQNAVNLVNCNGNSGLTLEGGTYQEMVIVTGCDIKFSAGVILEDVMVATTDTSARSMTSSSGLQIGKDDNCATGGGTILLTKGGFSVASKLKVYGGQILAMGDIEFSANANGIQGASFVSGGNIDSTSNLSFGSCDGAGMERNITIDVVRMVM